MAFILTKHFALRLMKLHSFLHCEYVERALCGLLHIHQPVQPSLSSLYRMAILIKKTLLHSEESDDSPPRQHRLHTIIQRTLPYNPGRQSLQPA